MIPKIGEGGDTGMQCEGLGARRGDMGAPEMGSLMTLSRVILTEMTSLDWPPAQPNPII